MNVPKRIGLFGGTFDPVHTAHVALAQLALDELRLDELRWIPAGQPWQKDRKITSTEHREAMVRLAIEDEPRFVLERCEIERQGPSYTLDTVRELQARHAGDSPSPRWFLIIGQDQYAGLHSWHDWRELLGLVTLAVANRPGVAPLVNREVQAYPHRAVGLPMMDLSSTDIRARVARGEPIAGMVPAAVAGYIGRHALYV